MNKHVDVIAKLDGRTLFKSRWSSKSATGHMMEGNTFMWEIHNNEEGFVNALFVITDRIETKTEVLLTVKRLTD